MREHRSRPRGGASEDEAVFDKTPRRIAKAERPEKPNKSPKESTPLNLATGD